MAKIGSLRLFESHASVTIYQWYQVPTNAIVPRDTIIQLPKSYLEGYFLKCLAARKRRAKPSRKRRKGRRKKEERTYANWQLEIATERNWSRLRGKLLKLHLTGNISQRNAWILLLISSCFKNWPQGATNFQEARVSRVPRVSGCVLLRLSSVFV